MKTTLVLGAGGFIGSHLVRKLKQDGHFVRGVDVKHPSFSTSEADEFIIADLRKQSDCTLVFDRHFDEVYQLAADMGGAGYIFSGEHDLDVMVNSAGININVINAVLEASRQNPNGAIKIFYSSSACMYPEYNQTDPNNPECSEESAYPAKPDSEYGWEKLFGERLYLALQRNYGIQVRIARFHNIFGPEGTWRGGKEKAPAAMCRKVAEAKDGSEIEIWGDGEQTRSFLYIEECVEGVQRLMASDFSGPVNIGSDQMVTINELVDIVSKIAGKNIRINHVKGPLGVRGRNSDNKLIREKLGWSPSGKLEDGIEKTYRWIEKQIEEQAKSA